MTLPLVSILIPAYNAAQHISSALESVFNQSYPNIEIIVVNDGSTDNTLEMLKQYSGYIQVITQQNSGQCAANNQAFRESKGEYVKFFDADDLMSPDHIAIQVEKLLDHPNSIAAGECWRFYENDLSTKLYEPLANWQDLSPIEWLTIDNGKGLGMMQCGLFLIPRAILDRAGLWDEELSLINDFEFFPRLFLNAEQLVFTPNARLYYRSGRQSTLSAQQSEKHLESAFKALSKTTELLLAYDDSFAVRKVLALFWRIWSYQFYPYQIDYYNFSEEVIKKLGHSPNYTQKGLTGTLSLVLGWKTVKWIKFFLASFKKHLGENHSNGRS